MHRAHHYPFHRAVGSQVPLRLQPGYDFPVPFPEVANPAMAPLQSINNAIATNTQTQGHFAAYPVAVRSPYLNSWLFGQDALDTPTASPHFWNGQTLGLEIGARVNGQTFGLFGYPNGFAGASLATQESIELTGTHTKITVDAGGTQFIIDFLNPVSPKDFVRQSLPYTYVTVSPVGSHGTIDIYTAIDESWTAQAGHVVTTPGTGTGNTKFFESSNPNQILYQEINEMAGWGTAVIGSQPSGSSTLTAGCGPQSSIHSAFSQSGTFSNPASCPSGSWAALAQTLGSSSSSATFAIGHSRENAINYLGKPQTPYHRVAYPTISRSISAFLSDYSAANSESQSLDNELATRGNTINSNYTDILKASLVQTFGASELTVDKTSLSNSTLSYFTKEISSDGNLNTLDIIYPTHPAYVALNPSLIRYSLYPLLNFLTLPNSWQGSFAPHDLGQHYPNATGYISETQTASGQTPEYMPLQSTSILLTLLQTYQKLTGDTAFAAAYKTHLAPFAEYLRLNGLAHESQLQTVDGLGPHANQTMLALASAVGLSAYGALFGNDSYTSAGQSLGAQLWTAKLGTDAAQTHFTFAYGQDTTWCVPFPLFSDALLGTRAVPAAAYAAEQTFLAAQVAQYGLPYVTAQDFAISDWNMYAAAVLGGEFQKATVDTLRAYLALPSGDRPFQTKYYARGPNAGLPIQDVARPTVGSNFALVVLGGEW